MDVHRPFHTPGSFALVRLEQAALLATLIALTALHLEQVRWLPFVAAFVWIDLVGYLPGAVAYRRARRRGEQGPIPPLYHHLYNVTHSYLTAGLTIGLWGLAAGGFEWAMTAPFIHLAGDRGLFGNVYKPAALPFEPEPAAEGSASADSPRQPSLAGRSA